MIGHLQVDVVLNGGVYNGVCRTLWHKMCLIDAVFFFECCVTKSFSVYLDVLRLCAALLVCFAHLSSFELSAGKFWHTKAYDQLAVMVFFVLSGYVISWVTIQKKPSAANYARARFSRIYSVLVPALVLTAICDSIGLSIRPELYHEASWVYPEGSQVVHYILSFFLVQNIWDAELNPGINGPLWSLTFEWFYYALFGAFLFTKGWVRVLLCGGLAIVAGPTILLLFPIWLLGVAACKLHQTHQKNTPLKAIISLVAMLALWFLPPLLRGVSMPIPFIGRENVFADYLWGGLVFLHLLGLPSLLQYMPAWSRLLVTHGHQIKSVAVYTFALYLFHRPLIQLVAAIKGPILSGWGYYAIQWCVVILVTWSLGWLCEKLKNRLMYGFKKTAF